MKQIKIAGFSTDTSLDYKPALCVFGEENVGKSRFGCTAPHDDGMIGWLALDKNSKATIDAYKRQYGVNYILVNDKPLMSHQEAIKAAMTEKAEDTKKLYKELVGRIFDMGTALAESAGIESIVIDNASQVFDWILFSHFGRRNQIESFMRGAPNQDMIDLINALGSKSLLLIHRSADVWGDTGEVDNQGKKKQAPTGKKKPEGFNKVGAFVTATLELTAQRKRIVKEDPSEALAEKYRCRVLTCKGNTLLEGQDLNEYGVSGEQITWPNVMTALGIAD